MKLGWAWMRKGSGASPQSMRAPSVSLAETPSKFGDDANANGNGKANAKANGGVSAPEKESFVAMPVGGLSETLSTKLALGEDSTWKERFEAAAKASESIIYEWNPQARRTTFSAAFSRLTGYEPEEAQDHLAVYPQWLHAEDRSIFQEAIIRLITRNQPFQIEYRLIKKDGEILYLQDTGQALLRDDQTLKRVVGIMVDITERKKNEARLRAMNERLRAYRALMESTGAGYLALAPGGVILDANVGCARLLGLSDPESLRGRDIFEWTAPEDSARLRRELGELVDDGEPRGFRVRQNREDRRRIIVEINASRYESSSGTKILALCQDLTDRLEREREHHQAQRLQALGTLAGGVAHDFNNILTAVMGFSDLIRSSSTEETPHWEFAREIMFAAERGRRLVQRILAFGRSADALRKPMALGRVIEEAASLLRAAIPSTIEIETRIEPDAASSLVCADSTQIHQELMNLGTNSAHAMRQTGGLLRISLKKIPGARIGVECDDDDDGPAVSQVCLTVSDTGVGMTPEVLEHIFDPFFTTKSIGEGTGLGLSMVHGIVRAHQGTIEIESEPGRGSTFRILLPIVSETAANREAPETERGSDEFTDVRDASPDAPESASDRAASCEGQAPGLLLVDDETVVVDLFRTMLTAFNYRASSFDSPLQALEAFRANPANFDLLLTDMTMPKMTGLDLIKAVREIRPELPVILVTGHNDALTSEILSSVRLDAFLHKPVKLDDLDRAIRRVLAARVTGSDWDALCRSV